MLLLVKLLLWSFCSRYTFGKPVSGTLMINMTVNGVGYYSQEVGRAVLRTMKVRYRNPVLLTHRVFPQLQLHGHPFYLTFQNSIQWEFS